MLRNKMTGTMVVDNTYVYVRMYANCTSSRGDIYDELSIRSDEPSRYILLISSGVSVLHNTLEHRVAINIVTFNATGYKNHRANACLTSPAKFRRPSIIRIVASETDSVARHSYRGLCVHVKRDRRCWYVGK